MRVHHRAYIRLWLSSLGYPVQGVEEDVLEACLLREAHQWHLAPESLEALVVQGYAADYRLVWRPLASYGLILWKPLAAQGTAQAA